MTKKSNNNTKLRNRAQDVLAFKTGAITTSAFPKCGACAPTRRKANKKNARIQRGLTLACWDATHPSHLPLPRAVGPYLPIRVTRRFSSNAEVVQLGTFMQERTEVVLDPGRVWTNVIAVQDENAALDINGAANARFITVPMPSLGFGAVATPGAFTVQLMNPNPLQTTSGVVYTGVMNVQGIQGGETITWRQHADAFVNFQSPRLLAAPRIALRGVQMNSYPQNMAALADFTHIHTTDDFTATYDPSQPYTYGWSPMTVYNPNQVTLEYLVTVEWRVRFDLGNPASAGHVHHPISSDSVWDRLMRGAIALGNGVHDIAEVANAVERVAQGVRQLAILDA